MQPDNSDQNQEDRLDFILQTELEKPKSFSEKIRSKAGLALGSLVIITFSIVFILVVFSNNQARSAQNERLISIAQTQTEIVRISGLAQSQAKKSSTRTNAQEITDKISSSLEEIKAMLVNNKANVSEENFNAKKNADTDSKLVESIQNNNFDDTFSSIMEQNLLDYQQQLLDAQNSANSNDKVILENAYNQVNEILGIEDQG